MSNASGGAASELSSSLSCCSWPVELAATQRDLTTLASVRGDHAHVRAFEARVQLSDVHSPWLFRVLVAVSVLAWAGVVYATSYRNFFYDEWDFVTAYRPSQSTSILLPHNEHWSTIPILIYKGLFAVFGLRNHVPYEAAAAAVHVACVFLIFLLIRRRSGELPAFAAALVLLFLGTGALNTVFAFQVGWTLSIAFGLLAMLLIDAKPLALGRWRLAAISGLLLASLMSSGIGLGFLVAGSVQMVLDRTRRHLLAAVAVPFVAYVAWFIAYGAGFPGTPGAPCHSCSTALGVDLGSIGPGYPVDVVRFVWLSLTASIGGLLGLSLVGLPIWLVQAIWIATAGLLIWHWLSKGINSWEVALIAGMLIQLFLIGLTRVRFGLNAATESRYVYVGVIFLLPIVANALRDISWSTASQVALTVGFGVILLSNGALLVDQALSLQDLMQKQNTELRVVELFRGAADIALNRPLDDQIMPQLTAANYYAAIDELGSPVPSSVSATLDELPAATVDHELDTLFGQALQVTSVSQTPSTGRCQTFDSSAGQIDLQIPDGQSLTLRATRAGNVALALGYLKPASSAALQLTQLDAGKAVSVRLPDTGRPIIWRLRVRPAPIGDLQICGL